MLAYKRKTLVKNLITQLTLVNENFKRKHNFEAFSKILIVQDGMRMTESQSGRKDFMEMRHYLSTEIMQQPAIEVILYERNVGLTSHMLRIYADVGESARSLVVVEEDKCPTLEGIEFLVKNKAKMDSYSLLDTLPFNRHTFLKQDSLATLATDNGNIILGDELLELSGHLWNFKGKYQDEFELNLYEYLSSFIKSRYVMRAHKFWSRHLGRGLIDVDRTDSLIGYALVLKKKLKLVPTFRLTEDWSDQDYRGKNVNELPKKRNQECLNGVKDIWGLTCCPKCEYQGVTNRLSLNAFSRAKNSITYRFDSITH